MFNLEGFIWYPLLGDTANLIKPRPGVHSPHAPHVFEVSASNNPYVPFMHVQFQDGSLKEEHTEGVHNEDLLLMVRERLLAFQDSEYRCRENAIAITKIEEALNALSFRTQERRGRGVEGTSHV